MASLRHLRLRCPGLWFTHHGWSDDAWLRHHRSQSQHCLACTKLHIYPFLSVYQLVSKAASFIWKTAEYCDIHALLTVHNEYFGQSTEVLYVVQKADSGQNDSTSILDLNIYSRIGKYVPLIQLWCSWKRSESSTMMRK